MGRRRARIDIELKHIIFIPSDDSVARQRRIVRLIRQATNGAPVHLDHQKLES